MVGVALPSIRADLGMSTSSLQWVVTGDVLGAVTSTAALLLLVYTVVSAPATGWVSARTLISFALVALLAVAFVLVERRVAHPLLRLGILRNRSVISANVAAMVMFGAYI